MVPYKLSQSILEDQDNEPSTELVPILVTKSKSNIKSKEHSESSSKLIGQYEKKHSPYISFEEEKERSLQSFEEENFVEVSISYSSDESKRQNI